MAKKRNPECPVGNSKKQKTEDELSTTSTPSTSVSEQSLPAISEASSSRNISNSEVSTSKKLKNLSISETSKKQKTKDELTASTSSESVSRQSHPASSEVYSSRNTSNSEVNTPNQKTNDQLSMASTHLKSVSQPSSSTKSDAYGSKIEELKKKQKECGDSTRTLLQFVADMKSRASGSQEQQQAQNQSEDIRENIQRIKSIKRYLQPALHLTTSTAINGPPVSRNIRTDNPKINVSKILHLVVDSDVVMKDLPKLKVIKNNPRNALQIIFPYIVNQQLDKIKMTSGIRRTESRAGGAFVQGSIGNHFVQQTPEHDFYVNKEYHKYNENKIVNLCLYYQKKGWKTGVLTRDDDLIRVAKACKINVYTWELLAKEFLFKFQ